MLKRRAVPGLIMAVVAAASCAKIEAPPGAPPDLTPPQLVSASPESLAVLPAFNGEVVFRFNEVISEGGSRSQGTGTGDLERLILLSPTTRPPQVAWHRDRITVRPREGWQPNRVYRVELLPGATDLRNNRATGGSTVVTFTTGAPTPSFALSGTAWDWPGARAAPGALIQAVHTADSLVYRGVADSSGGFSIGPLPDGPYLIYAVADQNRNGVRDPREAFDSVRVGPRQGNAGRLWMFTHDTVGPRIQSITAIDSASASVVMSQPVDPYHRLAASAVSVRLLPDSLAVTVLSLLPAAADDSAFGHHPADSAGPRVSRDTTGAARARDTTAKAAVKLPARPAVSDRLVLRVAGRWKAGARYVVTVRGVRNLNAVPADAVGVLALPAATPPSARADSAGASRLPADSGARRPRPR